MRQLQSIPIPRDLIKVANAFVDLQQARHEADYDVARTFTRAETTALIDQVDEAMAIWNALRRTIAADAYLSSLLAGTGMSRG
jgi:hypothetical protein